MENAQAGIQYGSVIPSLAFDNSVAAMEWYQQVFGARERMRLENPDKSIAHAEIEIGGSIVMLADEDTQYNSTPIRLGGNSVNLHVYVPDVDALFQKAVAQGAKIIIPVANQFYGDRSGRLQDPFGYVWIVATHVRDVSVGEMKKAFEEMVKNG
ncbi:MAG: VOC family protein [Flavisolibacter sp.]